jgi:predicted MFS family arabinose efflux permease
VMVPALAICAGAFAVIASIAHGLPHAVVVPAIVVAVLVWGVAGWSFYPPQQARLVEVAGLKATPIALSLNASFMYLGFSIGAATGSLVIHASGPASLGWVSAALEVVALAIVMRTYRVRQPKACPACA